jgi:hypothetical protein
VSAYDWKENLVAPLAGVFAQQSLGVGGNGIEGSSDIDRGLALVNIDIRRYDCERTHVKESVHGQLANRPCPSNLLEVPLHDEVFNIGPSHHKSLSLPKVDRAQFRLYDTAVAYDAYKRVEIARGVSD